MISYSYKAKTVSGETVKGVVNAQNINDAETQLAKNQLQPLFLTIVEGKTQDSTKGSESSKPFSSHFSFGKKTKANADEISDLLKSLQIMVRSGIPLVDALQTVEEGASSPALAKLAETMKSTILAGHSLDVALQQFPQYFPPIVCQIIATADKGASLESSLANAANYIEQRNKMKKSITGALVYPCMLMAVSFLTVFLFMAFILPTFGETFDGLDVELPGITKMMLSTGEFLKGNLGAIFISLVVFAIAFWKLSKTAWFSERFSQFLSRMPIIGSVIFHVSLARSTSTLATLTSTSIPIVEAINQSAKVSGVQSIRKAFESAGERVENGETLYESLTKQKIFPAMLLQLTAVGEKSGQLSELISTASDQIQDKADRKIKSMLSILEPALIIFMGLVIGGLTLSILMPLFTINQGIQ